MIIFSCLKKEFREYVDKNIICDKVYSAYKSKMGRKTKYNIIKSWANSLPYVSELLEAMPDNMGISIEYNINLTSKSIDVVLSGYDIYFRPTVILLELKQWEYVEVVVNQDAIVKTLIGKKRKKYFASCLSSFKLC